MTNDKGDEVAFLKGTDALKPGATEALYNTLTGKPGAKVPFTSRPGWARSRREQREHDRRAR